MRVWNPHQRHQFLIVLVLLCNIMYPSTLSLIGELLVVNSDSRPLISWKFDVLSLAANSPSRCHSGTAQICTRCADNCVRSSPPTL